MGRLIVIEGLDGSGKSTQTERLRSRLAESGAAFRHVKFPDYDDPSSILIKMYLSGEFGRAADDVGAYAATSFYAVDRFASYKRYWGDFYREGGIVLADRYTSSNAVHQAAKLPPEEWLPFLDWLYDYEYVKIGIPAPDLVIYLDMEVAVSQRLLATRYAGDERKKDIHERDTVYLERCREAALFAARHGGWRVVPCCDGDALRTVDDMAADIWAAVEKAILL